MVNSHCVPLGLSPSFGFGDRLGLATPGHVAALKKAGAAILPIFAQQSIREMTRTHRSPPDVMHDACRGAETGGYQGPAAADADHLKTPADIHATATAGFCFFTLDPSGAVEGRAGSFDAPTLAEKFSALPDEIRHDMELYRGKNIPLPTGASINFDTTTLMRAAVKYGRAIQLAISLARHVASVMERANRPYELELSIDETPEPTTAAEHYIIADQCRRAGVKLISLAPRFVGDFEKGVDFKGDIAAFENSLAQHAALARMLGPYKLSLHSGSDKLSVYPLLARHTQGRFHVKTAGTSYLEALRAISLHDAKLFRRIIDFSRQNYSTDRATYHVSAELSNVPAPDQVAEPQTLMQIYLDDWAQVPPGQGMTAPGRQILHTTYGSVLTNPAISAEFFSILREHPHTYAAILETHFIHHLQALR